MMNMAFNMLHIINFIIIHISYNNSNDNMGLQISLFTQYIFAMVYMYFYI